MVCKCLCCFTVYAPFPCQLTQTHFRQECVQYPYISISHDSYAPLTEPQLKLCTCMGLVYYCKNIHLLGSRSEHTCTSAIYYQTYSVMKAMSFEAKHADNLKLNFTLLDAEELILLLNLLILWALVCLPENRHFH